MLERNSFFVFVCLFFAKTIFVIFFKHQKFANPSTSPWFLWSLNCLLNSRNILKKIQMLALKFDLQNWVSYVGKNIEIMSRKLFFFRSANCSNARMGRSQSEKAPFSLKFNAPKIETEILEFWKNEWEWDLFALNKAHSHMRMGMTTLFFLIKQIIILYN